MTILSRFFTPTPTQCDACGFPLEQVMYDARLPRGSWATLCPSCFCHEGCRLGTGRGQKYRRAADGRFEKEKG